MMGTTSATKPWPRRKRVLATLLTPALVIGGLTAVAVSTLSASAASTHTGTYEIGSTPITLDQPTDPGMGVLTPNADAAEKGMFGPVIDWPIIPLQAALSRNGHLITYGTPYGSPAQGGLYYDSWDMSSLTASSHLGSESMHDYNSFCNSLVTMEDGRLLMVGGNSTMNTMLYDPNTAAQTMGQNLNWERWYSTSLKLVDGRVLVLGGANYYNSTAYLYPYDSTSVATTPEIGTGTGAWTALTGAKSLYAFGADNNRWWYPRAFNVANGQVLGLSGQNIWRINPNGAGALTELGVLPYDPKVSGSQVMYAPGKILIAGGGQASNDEVADATAKAALLDISGATVTASATNPMSFARNWVNLTVLPTGEVFANGGTKVGMGLDGTGAVLQSEIWNPSTKQWRLAATNVKTRTYHSVSLLLPSGALFTGGGGAPGPVDNLNAEIYYPSYLFTKGTDNKVSWASRPAITALSGSAALGGTLSLKMSDTRSIKEATLISAANVTHSQNTDQRRIPLAITQTGDTVKATLPSSMDTLVPGDYELTTVDSKGVPSPAQMLTIRSSGPGLVTVAGPNGSSVTPPSTVPSTTPTSTAPTATTPSTTTPTETTPSTATPSQPAEDHSGMDMGSTPMPSMPATTTVSPTPTDTTTSAPVSPVPATSTAPVVSPQPKPKPVVKPIPLTINSSIGLEAVGKAGYRVRHNGSTVAFSKASKSSSKKLKGQTSFIVRKGLGSKSGLSFEAADHPGWYLVAPQDGTGAVKLAKLSNQRNFFKRATFLSVKGAAGHDTSLRLVSNGKSYLQVKGSKLQTQPLKKTKSSGNAATFTIRPGLLIPRAKG